MSWVGKVRHRRAELLSKVVSYTVVTGRARF